VKKNDIKYGISRVFIDTFTILKYSKIKTNNENVRPPTTGEGIHNLLRM